MQPAVRSIAIRRFHDGQWENTHDLLAAEEPMEIRLGFGRENDRQQRTIAVTMRTPGHDFELAIGFLYTEGIISTYNDIASVRYCTDGGTNTENENSVRVVLQPEITPALDRLERNFYTTSSCGVCGKASIEAVMATCGNPSQPIEDSFTVSKELLLTLPTTLRKLQTVFEHTGGIHAAAIFNGQGELVLSREDVGRHNALDKLIGAAVVQEKLPFSNHILLLSGRASFELIQKAVMAKIPVVAAVGAPSGLAASLAAEFGITLIGFLREQRFNIYTGEQRIRL